MEKIEWLDSHFHPQYAPLSENSIKEAFDSGVSSLLGVATELTDFDFLLKCKQLFNIHISLGEHPLNNFENVNWDFLDKNIDKISAIGETGFDYQGNMSDQIYAFEIQAKLAVLYNLPIILHIRDSGDGIVENIAIESLKKFPDLKGVFHCFTGSENLAKFAISNNFFISFSGIITFPKCEELRRILKIVPLNKILIETDSPYLAPVPLRGKPNHPSYVRYIGEYIANFLNISCKAFSKILLNNFNNFLKGDRS